MRGQCPPAPARGRRRKPTASLTKASGIDLLFTDLERLPPLLSWLSQHLSLRASQVAGNLLASLMTEQEARKAISDIRSGINSVRSRVYDLDSRKGWKALGHRSFTACCTEEFPELHYRTIQKQLAAAQVEAKLAKLRPDGRDTGELPEAHLRPLVGIKNDDELLAKAFDEAVKDANENNNGKLTENIVAKAVEKVKPKPKAGDNAWTQSELERREQVLKGKTVVVNMHSDTEGFNKVG